MTTLDAGDDRRHGRRHRRPAAPSAPRTVSPADFLVLAGLFLGLVCLVMLSPFIWTIMSVTKSTDVAFVNPPVFAYRRLWRRSWTCGRPPTSTAT